MAGRQVRPAARMPRIPAAAAPGLPERHAAVVEDICRQGTSGQLGGEVSPRGDATTLADACIAAGAPQTDDKQKGSNLIPITFWYQLKCLLPTCFVDPVPIGDLQRSGRRQAGGRRGWRRWVAAAAAGTAKGDQANTALPIRSGSGSRPRHNRSGTRSASSTSGAGPPAHW